MILKARQTPEERQKYFTIIGKLALIALITAITLGRLEFLKLDFVIGMLYGFSVVGNIAYLVVIGRSKFGGQND
jgi:hypothetical protein